MSNCIYVAATHQHVGKTTSTLGLVATLRQKGINVGYCKPVGQEFVDLGDLKVDKDALLFAKVMDFELEAGIHSPVIVGRGVTTSYLDHPEQFAFRQKLAKADEALRKRHDVIVYEGTGHPGVGSVIDLSNADVAKMLGASVIMVVEGGIGSTIDELNANLALFREQDVPVIGVIVNKVIPQKIAKVKRYVGRKLSQMGIPLLGILPYDKSLANPIMETIQHAVNGLVLYNEESLDNKIENIVSGSLIEKKEFSSLKDLLLIVNYRRLDAAIESIQEIASRQGISFSPISGIIINGEGDFVPTFIDHFRCLDYIKEHKIPVVATSLDTYGSAVKISHIEVKINTRTPWKSERAIEMIRNHVDLEPVLRKVTEGGNPDNRG